MTDGLRPSVHVPSQEFEPKTSQIPEWLWGNLFKIDLITRPSWSRPTTLHLVISVASCWWLFPPSPTHLQPIQGLAREIRPECPAALITPLLRTLQGPSHQPGSGHSPHRPGHRTDLSYTSPSTRCSDHAGHLGSSACDEHPKSRDWRCPRQS